MAISSTTNQTSQTNLNSSVSALYGTSSSSSTSSSTSSSAVEGASAQTDKFLKLLVAQMQNQDPMNPLDNAQVTSQMAQISTVEGIEKLNSTMGKFTDSVTSSRAAGMSNLIGQSVLTAGSSITRAAGQTVQAGVDLDKAATQVVVRLLDANGNEVDRKTFANVDQGTMSFSWTGEDSSGKAYGAGTYRMVATVTGDDTPKATLLNTQQVVGVTQSAESVMALLGNGNRVATDDIKGVLAN